MTQQLELLQASKWPYDINAINKKHAEGDEEVKTSVKLGVAWLGETNSGTFRTWEDVKFLRDNWEGKLVLKGIQSVGVSMIFSDINVI